MPGACSEQASYLMSTLLCVAAGCTFAAGLPPPPFSSLPVAGPMNGLPCCCCCCCCPAGCAKCWQLTHWHPVGMRPSAQGRGMPKSARKHAYHQCGRSSRGPRHRAAHQSDDHGAGCEQGRHRHPLGPGCTHQDSESVHHAVAGLTQISGKHFDVVSTKIDGRRLPLTS